MDSMLKKAGTAGDLFKMRNMSLGIYNDYFGSRGSVQSKEQAMGGADS